MKVINDIEKGRLLRTCIIENETENAIKLINEIGVNTYFDHTTNPFIACCIHQNTFLVKYCLENKGDVNGLYKPKNNESLSMLAFCCRVGNLELVELLLKNNANPNFKNKNGISVLEEFIHTKTNKLEIMKRLLESNVDVNTTMTFNDNETFLEAISKWESFIDLVNLIKGYKKNNG
jgi:ankyrin repeat protein